MNGIIVINKPKGYTSHQIVAYIKKITEEKVGHTGTLDPLATGVLPLLIGKGTLCSKYLINHDKIYEVTLKLGIKTDTKDAEGTVLEEQEVDENILQETLIEKVFQSFLGEQIQTPPIYSAIKVKGRKLYEYARKGQEVEIPKRKITIYEIVLNKINLEQKEINFKVSCSKGTYIRSLCEDIAKALGTIGYMADLKRVKVGNFTIEDAVSIEDLEKEPKKEIIEKNLISIEELFRNCEKIEITSKKFTLFLNGVKLTTDRRSGIYRIYHNGQFIGIGVVENELLKRDIIL